MQYLLDIETLLLFLDSRRQSGELAARLKRFPGIAYKGPCHVSITVIQGKVVSCTIQSQEGRLLVEGESALRSLRGMGQLEWSWSTTSLKSVVAPPAQQNSGEGSSLIPRRIVPLEVVDRNVLPRRHWQVLLLIDGTRTAARIASILSPTAPALQEVLSILQDLQRLGIIVVVNT